MLMVVVVVVVMYDHTEDDGIDLFDYVSTFSSPTLSIISISGKGSHLTWAYLAN